MTNRSESVEMYLKSVAELGGTEEPVPIGRVAERLGISPVSASEMMRRLGEQGFIEHRPYKGVTLTGDGRRLAHSVIRRQRLWECFLVDQLKLDWARAYELACSLEHATEPEVVEALAVYLNHPDRCPHGNPIPGPAGEIAPTETAPLDSLSVGRQGEILAILPENGEVLAYLDDKGIRPGQRLKVVEAAPLEGPLTLEIEGRADRVALGLGLAALVLVVPD
jgi:DtxR family Mn-dependent transcriptional regulator